MKNQANILVIEDDKEFRETLVKALKKEGYQVEGVFDSIQALKIANEKIFNIIVADIRLPGVVDGIESIKRLKEINPQLKKKIILMTGFADGKAPVRAINIGVDQYIYKPFDLKLFLSVIKDNLKSLETGGIEKDFLNEEVKEDKDFIGKTDVGLVMNKIPKFGKDDYIKESVDKRREWLSKVTGVDFKHIGVFSESTEKMKCNIENLIGVSQIPLAVVGPVLVNGENAKGNFLVPMATTEGALVLDYQIGARILSSSSGANVRIFKDKVHISPLFYVKNVVDAEGFIKWIEKNFNNIKKQAESTTSHGELLKIEPVMISRRIILKFSYFTKDAQGLNMINKATEKACEYIKKETNKEYCLRSHYSSIKGASTNNIHLGQGKAVFADVTVNTMLLSKFFGVNAKDVANYYHSSMLAGINANRIGINGHVANALTAIFMACGQDVADISVSHISISACEVTEEGDLYVSVYIPNLFVGTVGGGTGLGTQKECLEIMGCYGKGKAKKFAEIIAATVLAGEISVICALVSGNYVQAHEIHGRNKQKLD